MKGTLRHKAGNERDIARQPVHSFDTRTKHLAERAADRRQQVEACGPGHRRSPFPLRVFADDGALSCRETLNRRPLGFYAKARALLPLG